MQPTTLSWQPLVGRRVILNGFGIVRVLGVEADRLLVGDGDGATPIPLAVVRTVEILDAGPGKGPAPPLAAGT